jgi:hypothetical protein
MFKRLYTSRGISYMGKNGWKDHRSKLPKRIPSGGKDSNELDGSNGNGNGMDGGDMLNGHGEDPHGWKEKHASDSEAIVKAERHGKDEEDPSALQKRTVEHFEKISVTVKETVVDDKLPKK